MIAALYRFLTDFGAPAIHFYLRRRLASGREDAPRFQERLGVAAYERPEGHLIWCHAASVGEAASLLALIGYLRSHYARIPILITSGTVTSAKMLEGRLPDGVVHQYMPVDRLAYVRAFLNHWKPDLVLWVESELWPNMLAEIKARRIPAILLNGRMSDKSFRQWYRVKTWARDILGTFSLCLTQTEAERGRFVTLGAKPVRCIGNLKYAADPLPVDPDELDLMQRILGRRPVWVMASTHRGEEEFAIDAHRQLKQTYPDIVTIIAPRHAARGDEVALRLKESGLNFARRSARQGVAGTTDIYLADTMGELGLFYRLCPVVAMGGSFVPVGGHNPVEAAQLGAALLLGPHMFNFAEIVREFTNRRAALQLSHGNELAFSVGRLLGNPAERDSLARNAKNLASEKRHVLHDIMLELRPWLPADPRPSRAATP